MSGGLEFISAEVARTSVARSLGLPDTPADRHILQFEILRAVIWALTSGSQPVRVVRVLNRATLIASAILQLADDRQLRSELREALDALADAGDVVELDGGHWLPATTRFVVLDDGAGYLLVGGAPTKLLTASLRGNLEPHGAFRRLTSVQAIRDLSLPYEEAASWARLPTESVEAWATDLLANDLPTYTEPRDDAALQFYAPEHATRGAPQSKRWFEKTDRLVGRYLACRTRIFGLREYRLAELSMARVVQSGAMLAPGEARRLMYALDARAHNPVSAWWRQDVGHAQLIVRSALPRPEQRLFGALGTVATDPVRPYEHRWTFHTHFDLVLKRLRMLGIEVKTLSTGGLHR